MNCLLELLKWDEKLTYAAERAKFQPLEPLEVLSDFIKRIQESNNLLFDFLDGMKSDNCGNWRSMAQSVYFTQITHNISI